MRVCRTKQPGGRFAALILLVILAMAGVARAAMVQIPDDVAKESPEAQARWAQEQSVGALAEQRAVGEERFKARMEMKMAQVDAMREIAQRRREIEQASRTMLAEQRRASDQMTLTVTLCLVVLGLGGIALAVARRMRPEPAPAPRARRSAAPARVKSAA